MRLHKAAVILVCLLLTPNQACPFLGYLLGVSNPHEFDEQPQVLDRRTRKQFERHVIKKQL